MSTQQDDEKVILLAARNRGRADEPPPPSEDDYGAADDPRPPAYSDDALALRFTALHGATMRHVAKWGRWYRWNGQFWQEDQILKVFDAVRLVCRTASAECNKPKVSVSISSAKTVAAVEKLARSDPQHAATVNQWDCDAWLLNTPGGILDLATGATRPHDPGRHMTKITAVAPDGECPLWHKFLAEITLGDRELQAYLQRVAGYCLTGSIREHALFFAHGSGGNGKGTFLNTIKAILGDYAMSSDPETFTAQTTGRHLTELARLQGARIVIAQETEEGRPLAEARVKAITGGDPITANFMRHDHFTYNPQFKLFIAGNHKPVLRVVDRAIRRRLHMIPFVLNVTDEEIDRGLSDKLRAEWSGILQWMMDGCREWQLTELAPPGAVVDATGHYFEAEDTFGQWLAECCRPAQYGAGESTALFKSWVAWAKAAGEPGTSQKRFVQSMEARGYHTKRGHGGKRLINGIDLIIPPPHSETEYDR